MASDFVKAHEKMASAMAKAMEKVAGGDSDNAKAKAARKAKRDDRRIPKPVKIIARAIQKKEGIPYRDALAIAIARLRQLGYLEKNGVDLTEKGRSKLSKWYKKQFGKEMPKQ